MFRSTLVNCKENSNYKKFCKTITVNLLVEKIVLPPSKFVKTLLKLRILRILDF